MRKDECEGGSGVLDFSQVQSTIKTIGSLLLDYIFQISVELQ